VKRRATSPVLAEFMLIVVAVIVALPIGSFVFGLIGSNTAKADITVATANCTAAGPSTTSCEFSLTNLGTANAQFQPYSLILIAHGNETRTDSSTACTGKVGNEIVAGSTLQVDCSFNVVPGNSGDEYSGWLSVNTVGWIPFAGRF